MKPGYHNVVSFFDLLILPNFWPFLCFLFRLKYERKWIRRNINDRRRVNCWIMIKNENRTKNLELNGTRYYSCWWLFRTVIYKLTKSRLFFWPMTQTMTYPWFKLRPPVRCLGLRLSARLKRVAWKRFKNRKSVNRRKFGFKINEIEI